MVTETHRERERHTDRDRESHTHREIESHTETDRWERQPDRVTDRERKLWSKRSTVPFKQRVRVPLLLCTVGVGMVNPSSVFRQRWCWASTVLITSWTRVWMMADTGDVLIWYCSQRPHNQEVNEQVSKVTVGVKNQAQQVDYWLSCQHSCKQWAWKQHGSTKRWLSVLVLHLIVHRLTVV